jgi:thymidylate synthase (FAD)
VCINCHSKLHHGWYVGLITHSDEIISIKYCGKEDVYDIEMNDPYHNYIANGFVVHNSTRYCSYDKDKFGNEITVILPVWFYDIDIEDLIIRYDNPDTDLKFSSKKEEAFIRWYWGCQHAEYIYFDLLKLGQKPEEARSVLPNSLKTNIFVTFNLREWRHFFELRTSGAAHPQIRQLSREILTGFKLRIPVIFEDMKGE